MEIKVKKINKKGFTLLEVLVASLILAVVGSGIAGVYIMEERLFVRTLHRLEAVNYARSALEELLALTGGDLEVALKVGDHTDPEICDLPDGQFKERFKGALSYRVDEFQVSETTNAKRIEVIVKWQEKFPKKEDRKETLVTVASFLKIEI